MGKKEKKDGTDKTSKTRQSTKPVKKEPKKTVGKKGSKKEPEKTIAIGEEEKDPQEEVVAQQSLPKRIIFKTLRVLLLWVPVSLIIIILVALLGLKLFLSAERVENLIITNFNKMSYGEISLKVKSFSPYRGFEIDNIVIKNGEEFGKTTFVEIEKLNIKYGLFPMLIGNVRIPEIGIYRPRIHLVEKNGVWNAARLMKPGEKKPEEKKEEKKEEKEDTGPTPKEINLPISVEFLFKFILDDLRVYVDGSTFSSKLEGLTFGIDIWVPPFKTIPTSIEAVSLLERMQIQLNPKEQMNVSFYSKDAAVQPPLILTWKLAFDKTDKEKPQFLSYFKFGTYKTPVRFKRSHLAPLNFMVSYDMIYNPLSDFLTLNHLGIAFRDKKWLNLAGSVKNVTKKQQFYLRMTESNIVLNDLYPYFLSVTGNRKMKFRGTVSLFPLTIQGNPQDIDIEGAINLKDVYFKMPGTEATIPNFTFSYSVLKRTNDMFIQAQLKLPHLYYTLGRQKSGDTGLFLGLNVSGYNNFQRVDIKGINFNLYNPGFGKNNSALSFTILGKVNLKPALSGNISIAKFRFYKPPLVGMLTKDIKKAVAGIPLKKPLHMDLNTNFALGEIIRAKLGILLKVPDFGVNDLKIATDVVFNGKKQWVTLNRFFLGSRSKDLSITASGALGLKPMLKDADLKLKIKLNPKKMKVIQPPWKLKGLLEVTANVKGDLKTGKAFGKIKIDKFYVSDGKYTSIDDINMAFPFEYYFTPRYTGESRIAVDKSQVIDNENFKAGENFTIKSIKAKHPSRDLKFEFVKDFAATMFFRNNTFELVKLKAYVLDGSLYGRDILFNLADMKPKNWEYKLILDVTNVDIGKLDEPDPAKKKRDAELSLNANFTGKDLSMFAGKGKDKGKELNVKGKIDVYKISEQFANKLMMGLSQEKGKSKLGIAQPIVDNTMIPRGFNYFMDKGLVYAKVKMEKKLIGLGIGVYETIPFERIPIQVYLNNLAGGK